MDLHVWQLLHLLPPDHRHHGHLGGVLRLPPAEEHPAQPAGVGQATTVLAASETIGNVGTVKSEEMTLPQEALVGGHEPEEGQAGLAVEWVVEVVAGAVAGTVQLVILVKEYVNMYVLK